MVSQNKPMPCLKNIPHFGWCYKVVEEMGKN